MGVTRVSNTATDLRTLDGVKFQLPITGILVKIIYLLYIHTHTLYSIESQKSRVFHNKSKQLAEI